MPLSRDLLTAQDRIAWAIDRAKRHGTPPEALAAKAGVTRPGMLHWTKETTKIDAVGIGSLTRFASAAGVNLDWLMTGRGDPVAVHYPRPEVAELAEALEVLACEEPAEYKVIAKLIRVAHSDIARTPPQGGDA